MTVLAPGAIAQMNAQMAAVNGCFTLLQAPLDSTLPLGSYNRTHIKTAEGIEKATFNTKNSTVKIDKTGQELKECSFIVKRQIELATKNSALAGSLF